MTFFWELRNLELIQSLHRCVLSFLTITVDLAFGKILKNGKSHSR